MRGKGIGTCVLMLLVWAAMSGWGRQLQEAAPSQAPASTVYLLGPRDEITIRTLQVEEISDKPVRIDTQGMINLPMVGRLKAAGLSVEELENEIAARLKTYVHEPEVTVSVVSFRSQPVSVLGAVGSPGVHQLEGSRNLYEVLSMAGGLKPEAGYSIKITRRKEWGRIPLAMVSEDPTGQFYVADVSVKSVMDARNPEENILIRPHDVISVPRGEMVYVIGAVQRAGGFVLGESEIITVLQALSLAQGLGPGAAPGNAKILRTSPGSTARTEIPVDLKMILEGKSSDVPLGSEDILFVPASTGKNVARRTLEAAISIGTGVAIWRSR